MTDPDTSRPTKTSAWIEFAIFFAGLTYFFPWLLGFAIGVSAFYSVYYSICKAIGAR